MLVIVLLIKKIFISENSQVMSLADYDLTCIAGTLKKYLRQLPDPVIPEQYYNKFIEAASKFEHSPLLK